MGKAVAVTWVRRRMRDFFPTHPRDREWQEGHGSREEATSAPHSWEGCLERLWDPHPGQLPAPVGLAVTWQLQQPPPEVPSDIKNFRTRWLSLSGTGQKFVWVITSLSTQTGPSTEKRDCVILRHRNRRLMGSRSNACQLLKERCEAELHTGEPL